MADQPQFRPTWISPPGDTIRDILLERGISLEHFAPTTGSALPCWEKLISGEAEITKETAALLANTLGGSDTFWLERERSFRERRATDLAGANATEMLAELPVRQMRTLGWLDSSLSDSQACLQFFGASTVASLREGMARFGKTAFRTSPTFKSSQGSVYAWLRRGENEATTIECQPWNLDRLKSAIPELRKLTRQKDPQAFWPNIVRLCAECGVAVVFVKAPQGVRASGATRFITAEKALILVSFRHLSDDHFWFTFFHEIGHLVLHGRNSLFIEGGDSISSQEEDEANRFSADTLISRELQPLLKTLPIESKAIMNFARKAGVSPGIVVGQMQHKKIIPHSRLNSLKRRYAWGD